jgi:hypothetical protein
MNIESGSYGGWMHLNCWRVPFKVWTGLPDPSKDSNAAHFEAALLSMNEVTLCGVSTLTPEDRSVISH